MKVHFYQPNLGFGVEVEIPGLGLFVNNTDVELTQEQLDTFQMAHTTIDVPDAEKPQEVVSTPGKPLAEVIDSIYGLTIVDETGAQS